MTWYCQDCRKEPVDSKDNVCVDCRNKTDKPDKKWFRIGAWLLIGSTIIYTAVIFTIIGIGGVF